MRRKFQKLFLFVFMLFFVYTIYQFYKSQTKLLTNKENFKTNKNLIKTTKYKVQQGNTIWEQMNENVFFKRSSTFYVIERSLLRLYYLRRKNSLNYEYDLRIQIELAGAIHHIYLANATVNLKGGFDNYVWESLSYKFDLLKHLNKDSYDEILNEDYKFQLYISNSNNTYEKTLYPIDVSLKYIRSRPGKEKKGSIVCSKCFWFKEEDYKDLFWWIELNRQAGYKKIVFCNNSIPNTKNFNDLFEKNKDFIEISQLNFIPNFVNQQASKAKSNVYLNYYEQVSSDFPVTCDTFNMMILNECFLNNTQKYHHIAVFDPDEVILPRENNKLLLVKDNFDLISKLKFDSSSNIPTTLVNLESSCSLNLETKLDKYLNSLNKKPTTYYFHMGFYLKENQVEQIIEAIEFFFQNEKNISQIHKLTVNDKIQQSNNHNGYNFTFIIKNQEEISYALNLCKIYRNLIQSIEKRNSNHLIKYSKRFRRFFYIGGLLSSFANGKSIHSSDVTFDLSIHFPDPDKNYPDQAQIQSIDYDFGHLSHFRHVNEFHKSSQKEVSITELILDLNYLNCYYKPIIENFSKIKLF